MEVLLLVWVLCAGICYLVARDRAPSQAGMATALGFFLGPLGILITFFLQEADKTDKADQISTLDTDGTPKPPTRSIAELTADLDRLKKKL